MTSPRSVTPRTVILRRSRAAARAPGTPIRAGFGRVYQARQLSTGQSVAIRLELGNLRSADAAGLAALRHLHAAGVEMRDLSPHLAWQVLGSGE